MTAPSPHVVAALLEWRNGLAESGRNEASSLPSDNDVLALAAVDPPSRPAFEALSLERPSAVKTFGAGILMAVRSGREAAAAGAPAPALPPPFAAPPPPTAPLPAPPPAVEPVAPADAAAAPDPPPRKRRSRTADSAPAGRSADVLETPFLSPSPAPVPPPTTATATQPAPGPVADGGFAAYDATTTTGAAPLRAMVTTLLDGTLAVEWAKPAGRSPVRIYRVVSSDDYRPWSPDAAQPLLVTTGTSAVDSRPLTTPVRHLQVWMHEGPDDAGARADQPRLIAAGVAVAPPRDVVVTEDHGTVVGSWKVNPGVRRVEVLRVPLAHAGAAGYMPQYRVATPDDALQGMQDSGCQAGEEYEYRLYAVVVDDETEHISDAVVRRVTVAGSLAPIREVRCRTREDNGRVLVDLEWDQETSCAVEVYRTEAAPVVGAADEVLARSALPQTGLDERSRVAITPHWADGVGRLHGVPWPPELSRVHFTAVSVDRTGARVGHTATLTRTGGITDAVLRQRVSSQVLTFGWPAGAAEVRVYRGPLDSPLPEPPGPPLAALDAARYQSEGGLRLRGVLEPDGCEVHLVPVSFYGGEAHQGQPASVRYPGLFRIAYRLVVPEAGRFAALRGGGGSTLRRVEVVGDRDSPPDGLMLTWHLVGLHDRLPLSPQDGQPVGPPHRGPAPGRAPMLVGEFDSAQLPTGSFVRLFAVPDPGTRLNVALLDPSLSELTT